VFHLVCAYSRVFKKDNCDSCCGYSNVLCATLAYLFHTGGVCGEAL
jgi:hypothetical protein